MPHKEMEVLTNLMGTGLMTQPRVPLRKLNLALKQMELQRRPVPTEAIKDYSVKEKIIECNMPLVKALKSQQKGNMCDYCLKRSNLQMCGKCSCFWYCSKECQIADWNEAHKFKECLMYKKNPRVASKMKRHCRLVARLYLMIRAERQGAQTNDSASAGDFNQNLELLYKDFTSYNGRKRNLIELESHFEKRRCGPYMDKLYKYIRAYKALMGPKYDWCSDDLLVVLGIIFTNSFELSLVEPTGTGLFPEISIFNHSCCPNASLIRAGNRMIIEALAPIKRGDTITIRYQVPFPRDQFHALTTLNYFFTCHCNLCKKIPPLDMSKYEFNALNSKFAYFLGRGYILLALLTAKDMIRIYKQWPDESYFHLDEQLNWAPYAIAYMGDLFDHKVIGLTEFGVVRMITGKRINFGQANWLVEFFDDYRFHRKATKKYAKGGFVREFIPNFYIVLPEFREKYCDMCLTRLKGQKPQFTCKQCLKFSYCSASCQSHSAKLHQTFECTAHSMDKGNLMEAKENVKIALYLRLYFCIKDIPQFHFVQHDERSFKKHPDGKYGLTLDKGRNKDSKNPPRYKVFCEDVCPLPSKFGNPIHDILNFMDEIWPSNNIDEERLVNVHSFSQNNLFNVYDPANNRKIAIGSFTTGRFTEHSCVPNCEFILENGKLSLRTKDNITSGEALTIGYY